ncbi:MAG: imidazole glycerol phosphate synthase cyclase subunit [Oscillospiraceae bacterium]|nr:imidazole glycerol phosphate synthase cyclase subunit [Oscillospiraceae bacterium]
MKKIIPCLDIRDGKVVKGVKFEGIQDVGDPVQRAALYLAQGADELVLYDISAAIEKRIIDLELVKNVADVIDKHANGGARVPLAVAGGIGTLEDFGKALDAGADKVSLNSLAIRNPDIIKAAADKYGSARIVIGIDATKKGDGTYAVMTGAGLVDTGLELLEWVQKVEALGGGEICLNSIDADGTKDGYDLDMLNAVCAVTSLPVTASGGCGRLEDFAEVFNKTNSAAALAASVFHFDILTVDGIKEYLSKVGVAL